MPLEMEDIRMQHWILIYLVMVNVLTFCLFGIDKWKACHSRWRIPEMTLLGLALVGGSIGAWLGMKVWHHKTKHKKFKYGIPLILMIQIVLVVLTACKTRQPMEQPSRQVGSLPVSEHSSEVFLVMYDPKVGQEPLLEAIRKWKCEVVYDYHTISGMALKKPEDQSLEATMKHFRQVKGVVTVEYDHIIRLTDPVRPTLETK